MPPRHSRHTLIHCERVAYPFEVRIRRTLDPPAYLEPRTVLALIAEVGSQLAFVRLGRPSRHALINQGPRTIEPWSQLSKLPLCASSRERHALINQRPACATRYPYDQHLHSQPSVADTLRGRGRLRVERPLIRVSGRARHLDHVIPERRGQSTMGPLSRASFLPRRRARGERGWTACRRW